MATIPKNALQNAIAEILTALSKRLTESAEKSREACEAMEKGEQNQAIGTVLDFSRTLPEAQALFNAALALHRDSR
jgi:hypothetical protein